MVLRAYRTLLGSLVLAAIAIQFFSLAAQGRLNPVNFFSFFTNLSNVVGACVLLAVSYGFPSDQHARDVARGAATAYLTIVGVVFSALLANVESDIIPWVNAVVHYVMPIAIAFDWCIVPPRTRIATREAAAWLIFPLAYVIYTLVRGAIVHWYPYPFLNADAIGYPKVAVYVAAMFVFTLLVAYVVMIAGNTLGARRRVLSA